MLSIPGSPHQRSQPELACVVLAVGNPPVLLDAVRSLLAQSEATEVVVINSGGGGAARSLEQSGLDIRVVEMSGRILPGAARNIGIDVTVAPWISFLAADCIAEPGWAAARIRGHRAGAAAVASSVTNPFRSNFAAWTSYVALFNRRMPGVPAPEALLYGVSYERSLFARCGRFNEQMRGGEDTEFHERLAASGIPIVWAPEVRTAHRHPTRLLELVRDQFRRGARSARAWQRMNRHSAVRVALNAFERVPTSARLAWQAAPARERKWIAAAVTLLPVAAAAYAAGSIAHALMERGREEE